MDMLELARYCEAHSKYQLNPEVATRLRELHNLTRWIPVEERLPTEEDADECGYILWWRTDSINLPDAGQWDLHTEYANAPSITHYTHWKRIDKPEGV